MSGFSRSKLLALSLTLGVAGGCSQAWLDKHNVWPFAKNADRVPGIRTPRERIDELRELVKKSPKAKPEERQQVAQRLAKQIQQERDPLVRCEIVRTLGHYPSPLADSVLKAATQDTDAEVRVVCCSAWGRRGGKESVDELCKLLNSDSDMDVRLAAARALGQTKEKIAMPQLADALSDSDPAMQHRLVQSLKNVSGKDFGGDVEAWRQYAKGEPVQEKPVSVAERFRKLF